MKLLALGAATAAALALAAPAATKWPERAIVCGADACRTFTDRATLEQIPGGEATRPLGRPSPYYRVEIVTRAPGEEPHSFFSYYVPAANAMAWSENGLVRLHPIFGPEANGVMRRLTRGLEPFGPPRIVSAQVGGRKVPGSAAQTYLGLFDPRAAAPLAESPADWIGIELRSRAGSPWTDGSPDLVYSPSTNLLEQGGRRVELSADVAVDVEAARELAPSRGSRFPWLTVALAFFAATALASLRLR